MDRSRIALLESMTGLVYCDDDCFCGCDDRTLKIVDADAVASWVPIWMNDIEPEDVERWLLSRLAT